MCIWPFPWRNGSPMRVEPTWQMLWYCKYRLEQRDGQCKRERERESASESVCLRVQRCEQTNKRERVSVCVIAITYSAPKREGAQIIIIQSEQAITKHRWHNTHYTYVYIVFVLRSNLYIREKERGIRSSAVLTLSLCACIPKIAIDLYIMQYWRSEQNGIIITIYVRYVW